MRGLGYVKGENQLKSPSAWHPPQIGEAYLLDNHKIKLKRVINGVANSKQNITKQPKPASVALPFRLSGFSSQVKRSGAQDVSKER